MHLLDAARQADQFRQLLAVPGVIARQEVGDQRLRRFVAPVVLGVAGVLQVVQGIGDQQRIEVLAKGRFAQAFMPAATEVQFEVVKDPCGAGNVAGQLAEALFQ
ncbi:hypothetical protein D3C86_1921910 [compost metagenome]